MIGPGRHRYGRRKILLGIALGLGGQDVDLGPEMARDERVGFQCDGWSGTPGSPAGGQASFSSNSRGQNFPVT